MATTQHIQNRPWDTFHNNGPWSNKNLWVTSPDFTIFNKFECYIDASLEIQNLIRRALTDNEGFRAYGAKWSFSDVAYHPDNMLHNSSLNLKFDIPNSLILDNSKYQAQDLFFFQCGNRIKEISEFLETRKKSLAVSGASNGQTIAGAISVGVHGSSIKDGSIQDYIVGINLVIGPNEEDNIYLERSSEAIVSEEFVNNIQSRIVRDDELFDAALTGLGSFGIIHGVMLKANNIFLLQKFNHPIDKNSAIQIGKNIHQIEATEIANLLNIDPPSDDLYHVRFVINPYNPNAPFMSELIFKKDYRNNYADPIPKIRESMYTELVSCFRKIAQSLPRKIPSLLKALESLMLPDPDEIVEGTLGEIFWNAHPIDPNVFATSFCVDHQKVEEVLDLFTQICNEKGPVPAIFAIRFVKQTKASLGYAKFPISCMIEIDGLQWKGNSIIPMNSFFQHLIDGLIANNIDFTAHWGKNNDWAYPGLAEIMYGKEKVDQWKKQRSKLLSEEMAQFFSNPFLERLNLNEYLPISTDDTASIVSS